MFASALGGWNNIFRQLSLLHWFGERENVGEVKYPQKGNVFQRTCTLVLQQKFDKSTFEFICVPIL